ncbi:Hypothetical predicted protein [Mytilus galloprovincialis]|uniref:C2H2-type domain-containing protein n=1 Tax=Mytilus galloprovincialis TaxID=29158 RepID=A0A8B6F5D5_MYTGA|nr:Hypothetical predicted protein [Mytilus galloprovincialis]
MSVILSKTGACSSSGADNKLLAKVQNNNEQKDKTSTQKKRCDNSTMQLNVTKLAAQTFACKICVKSFKTRQQWQRHHMSLHKREYVSVCLECCKAFKSAGGAQEHRLMYHPTPEDKFFTCNVCGKKHSTANKLRIHKRVHSDDKPYLCTVCDRSYKHKKDLDHHICTVVFKD